MSRHGNVLTTTTCRFFKIYGSSLSRQLSRNAQRRCLSTLRNRRTSQCQSNQDKMFGSVNVTGYNNHLILKTICIQNFYLPTHGFSTSTKRHSGKPSPGDMKRQLQSGMYGETIRGRMFDIRNTSKLATSFTQMPVFEIKRNWMLHVYPSYHLGKIEKSFSAGQFMEGADMTIAEMILNRKYINTELLNMLNDEVIFDLSFVNERTLCSYEIEQLQNKDSRISVTGVLRGEAMISTEMGKTLKRVISPTWMKQPVDIPMDLDIHFMYRCSRRYTYDEPHGDWKINGFTFLIDVPELFIAYIL
ncbi:uncharacterized protein [Argopecten irradians]|uniref:uncharacterized protein isoform X2 n=1 Tax=Argopecten irradians TaxID=31199 RepID=UPI003724B4E4